jgi:hypothetical protein
LVEKESRMIGERSRISRRQEARRQTGQPQCWPVSFEACFGEALGLFGKDTGQISVKSPRITAKSQAQTTPPATT